MDADPPFHEAYKTLFDKTIERNNHPVRNQLLIDNKDNEQLVIVEECELPLIDLSRLNLGEPESEECKAEIARASKEWGFFQVMKHGISTEILEKMRFEQERLFKQPFHEKSKEDKSKEDKYLRFSAGSYRWGTPSATNLKQLSWSEAFHIPLIDITPSGGFDSLGIKHLLAYMDFTITVVRALRATGSCGTYKPGCELPLGHIDFTSSTTMEQFAATVSSLAQKLAGILAENMGHNSTFFQENCLPNTCYLRMNHYPPCPISSEVFGLTPHTDSDFLTILHQDQVGGLQLVKDGRWISVKPNPEALIINIGDLFQAWSNDTYKSVQHRVITNPLVERFSTAYFFCPSYDTVIQSCCEPSVYRKFSFREYREQVQADVQKLGSKIGLPRFLM